MLSDDDSLFADRPEWSDVAPLEQYASDLTPLAPIIYTAEYKDASNYFRGIVKTGEKSLRVLDLTEKMIRLNPAHYTAWQYRYETLLSLLPSPPSPFPLTSGPAPLIDPLLSKELNLLDELSTRFLKTYQVWHHRRLIVSLTGQWKRELECITRIFEGWEEDAKNYHTWSYRQWILGYFGAAVHAGGDGDGKNEGEESGEGDDDVWLGEIDFVDSMLSKDVRNNSAWHHRFFVIWDSGIRQGEEDREKVLQRELTYVKQKISLAPNNPSAWNYLRGILQTTTTPISSLLSFVLPYTQPRLSKATITTTNKDKDEEVIIDLDNPLSGELAQLPCVEALEFVADVYEGGDVESAVSIWKSLAEEYDPIRKNYWQYRIRIALASETPTN